ARGDLEQAGSDAARAVRFSRDAGDPQNLYPALALSARVMLASGDEVEATARVDELLELLAAQPSFPSFWVIDAAIVLSDLDRGDELSAAAEHAPATRWLDAAIAYAAGDFEAAGEICAEIGALPEEAYVRVDAARAAYGDGRRARAEDLVDRALDFYRR